MSAMFTTAESDAEYHRRNTPTVAAPEIAAEIALASQRGSRRVAELNAKIRRRIDADEAAQRARDAERMAGALASANAPEWLHEYASLSQYDGSIMIQLPGCSPIRLSANDGFSVSEPIEVSDEPGCDWYVATHDRPIMDRTSLDEAIYVAAGWGDSYDAMTLEAARRNAAPMQAAHAEPEPQPDPLARIAHALEIIATVLIDNRTDARAATYAAKAPAVGETDDYWTEDEIADQEGDDHASDPEF